MWCSTVGSHNSRVHDLFPQSVWRLLIRCLGRRLMWQGSNSRPDRRIPCQARKAGSEHRLFQHTTTRGGRCLGWRLLIWFHSGAESHLTTVSHQWRGNSYVSRRCFRRWTTRDRDKPECCQTGLRSSWRGLGEGMRQPHPSLCSYCGPPLHTRTTDRLMLSMYKLEGSNRTLSWMAALREAICFGLPRCHVHESGQKGIFLHKLIRKL